MSAQGSEAEATQPTASGSATPGGKGLTGSRTSFVWQYFTELEAEDKCQCGAIMKDGTVCGKKIARDRAGSTKGMSGHLRTHHSITGLKVPGGQMNVVSSFKKIKTDHQVSFFPLHFIPILHSLTDIH